MVTTTTSRRVSKAAMRRRRDELSARPATRDLPIELGEVIDSYVITDVPAPQVPQVRNFLREVITASTLTGPESVRKHCKHVCALAAFALTRGLPLTIPAVMRTDVIDEYIRCGMAGAGDPLRAERRRRLLALAAAVNPGPDVPARLTPIPHTTIRPPYTPTELAVIARVAATQPTPTATRKLSAVVALGAGAGADSTDIRHLQVGHIHDTGTAGLEVHFQGPRPRVVPVRARFEDMLRSAVADRPAGALIIGVKRGRKNVASRAVERAALYRVPEIDQSRLRATWLADLMTDPIPVGVILTAAGLKSARSLVELLPHLRAWITDKGLTVPTDALRGVAS